MPRPGRDNTTVGFLAGAWSRLADDVELHLAAEDEVCWLPGPGHGPRARELIECVADDHAEIREAVAEARLLPAGSALWWRSVHAARARRLTGRSLSRTARPVAGTARAG